MSGPQVLLETVLVCEIKDPGSHFSEGKGRREQAPHQATGLNTIIMEMHVTQRSRHLHAAQPSHPCQP